QQQQQNPNTFEHQKPSTLQKGLNSSSPIPQTPSLSEEAKEEQVRVTGSSLKIGRCCQCCCLPSFCTPISANLFGTWKCIHFIAFSMGLPFLLVLLSYLLNSKGYETRR